MGARRTRCASAGPAAVTTSQPDPARVQSVDEPPEEDEPDETGVDEDPEGALSVDGPESEDDVDPEEESEPDDELDEPLVPPARLEPDRESLR